jgi:hypothetical protein
MNILVSRTSENCQDVRSVATISCQVSPNSPRCRGAHPIGCAAEGAGVQSLLGARRRPQLVLHSHQDQSSPTTMHSMTSNSDSRHCPDPSSAQATRSQPTPYALSSDPRGISNRSCTGSRTPALPATKTQCRYDLSDHKHLRPPCHDNHQYPRVGWKCARFSPSVV